MRPETFPTGQAVHHQPPIDPPKGTGKTFTIAHLSDPHLSRQYYREHIKSFKILLRKILDAGVDHVIITGDIVSTGDPDDYYLARQILTTFGLMDAKRLTVVPGNHDIFGGPHRAVDVLSFPQHIRSVDYRRRLALFEEAFGETFERAVRLHHTSLYPFVKRVGPLKIIGLNSIPPWSLWTNPLGSNGLLSDEQINALQQLSNTDAAPDEITLAAIHHHFNELNDNSETSSLWKRIESKTMRMKRRRKVLRLFRSIGVKAVLHGHVHRNELYERNGIRLANGAGAVCDDTLRQLKYNRLSCAAGVLTIELETLPVAYQPASAAPTFHRFRSVEPIPSNIPII